MFKTYVLGNTYVRTTGPCNIVCKQVVPRFVKLEVLQEISSP